MGDCCRDLTLRPTIQVADDVAIAQGEQGCDLLIAGIVRAKGSGLANVHELRAHGDGITDVPHLSDSGSGLHAMVNRSSRRERLNEQHYMHQVTIRSPPTGAKQNTLSPAISFGALHIVSL